MTSPPFLRVTISTWTETRAPSWSVTNVPQAPMSLSTALQRPWGSAAPALRRPLHGARTVSSNAIAASLCVLQALLRKRPAQPPKTASAHVHPTATCQGTEVESVSPTPCAAQAPGWKSGAAKQRMCSVSHALKAHFQMWCPARWSAEITQTARPGGWCCLYQGQERQIMSVVPPLLACLLSLQPLNLALHQLCLHKNPWFPQPLHHWLGLYIKVSIGILLLLLIMVGVNVFKIWIEVGHICNLQCKLLYYIILYYIILYYIILYYIILYYIILYYIM